MIALLLAFLASSASALEVFPPSVNSSTITPSNIAATTSISLPGTVLTSTTSVLAGPVGIGTASPGTKLHMSSGTLTVNGTAAAIVVGANAPAKVGGTLYSIGASTFSSAAAGEITLYQYTLPANTLAAAGDTLYITCISTQTGASTTRNNAIYFGGTLISPSSVSSGSTDWKTTSEMVYESSTRLKTFSERTRSGTWTTATSLSGDPTAANLIECRGIGLGNAGDLSGILFSVEWMPAP